MIIYPAVSLDAKRWPSTQSVNRKVNFKVAAIVMESVTVKINNKNNT